MLMLSFSGYTWYLNRRFRIRAEFVPALVCAFTGTLLFLAGCLNLLAEIAWLLFAGGLFLPVFSLLQKYKTLSLGLVNRRKLLETGSSRRDIVIYSLFLCMALYFFLLMQKAHVTSYDNFSHWATVVKDMLAENRMPNFQDPIIRFQSYPLGSSLWIYYVCRIAGASDGCMLWAQLLMMLSFLLCMAFFVQKENWYCVPALLCFCIWALSANNSIYELRVDTLLPLAGIAAFAVLYAYRSDFKKALHVSCSLFILLIQIKNSGIFFYAACLLFFAVYARKQLRENKRCFVVFGLFFPLFSMYLWKKHVAFAFAGGMDAKHSMNIAHFGEMAAKKTGADIAEIGRSILHRFTQFDSIEVKLLLSLAAVLLLFAVLLLKYGQAKKMLCLLAACIFCAAAYTASLYAMYVFSMPMGEAAHLASYDRYMLSVLIFLYGTAVIVTSDALLMSVSAVKSSLEQKAVPAEKGSGPHTVAAAIWLVCSLMLVWQVRPRLPLFYGIPGFSHTKRCQLQGLIQEHGIREGDSCAIYLNGTDDDKRYLFYLARYELWTDKVLVVRDEELSEHQQELSGYEHLIVWDLDERIQAFLDDSKPYPNFQVILRRM